MSFLFFLRPLVLDWLVLDLLILLVGGLIGLLLVHKLLPYSPTTPKANGLISLETYFKSNKKFCLFQCENIAL